MKKTLTTIVTLAFAASAFATGAISNSTWDWNFNTGTVSNLTFKASTFVPPVQPATPNLTNWSNVGTNEFQKASSNLTNWSSVGTNVFQKASANLTNWSTVSTNQFFESAKAGTAALVSSNQFLAATATAVNSLLLQGADTNQFRAASNIDGSALTNLLYAPVVVSGTNALIVTPTTNTDNGKITYTITLP